MIKKEWALVVISFCAASVTVAQTVGNVPFTIAKNYFINNTFRQDDLQSHKILTEQEFNQHIGMAAVMGKDGKPTEIDFSSQFVILVVNAETDISTVLMPKSLRLTGKKMLKFRYLETLGGKQGFTVRPFTMVIVDRKYKDRTIQLDKRTVHALLQSNGSRQ